MDDKAEMKKLALSDYTSLPILELSISDISISEEGDSSSSSSVNSYPIRRRKLSEDSDVCLPCWAKPEPRGPHDDDCGPVKRRVVFSTKKRRSSFSFSILAFSILCFALYCSNRSTIRKAFADGTELIDFSQKLGLRLRIAAKDVRLLEKELAALDTVEQEKEETEIATQSQQQSAAFVDPQLMREMVKIQRSLTESKYQAERLKEQVKDLSRRDALEKYGAGLKRIEFQLIFPDEESGSDTFVIEMAPIDLMPHSVWTFLEMASAGLLDGCSFILNALHVLKAAPLPYDRGSASDKAREFLDHGLESVAFREYSPSYPHKKHTVGFAADGSPSFYINTEDNTEIHAGDPCFAKVISGFDTIKRLENSPTRNGIWLEQRIGIKRANVL
jgi:cyclophilin family peptidyl-prolyl cis-trans isomerase